MRLLTAEQAAEIADRSPELIRKFCREGRLGFRHGNQWAIPETELRKFLRTKRPRGRPNPTTKRSK